jgi:TonB-linked SusC/RagA family outer membrane protein
MQDFATGKAALSKPLHQLTCLFKSQKAVRIMKITGILLLAACLQLSARGLTQSITLSVKDASLQQVFSAIEKQTDYKFFYNNYILQTTTRISVNARSLPLITVLEMIFKNQPVTYSIHGNIITIRTKKNENSVYTGANEAPSPIDVSGKVTDDNGKPLEGANVVEKGKAHGTTTNGDGVFLLKGVDENGSLEISYVGYQTLTVPINSRTSIAVSIKQSETNLTEVVINKGYYSEARRFSTSNVAQVTSKEIEQQPIQNPLLALEGRVPGIQITQLTGMPGAAVRVLIQGRNSIASGLDPLIIIDGVPYQTSVPQNSFEAIVQNQYTQNGNPLNYINPSDIESINILKDADATAIYGSRAANGAILITTKKGKVGRTKLGVNFQQGFGKVGHFVDMMNTQQYLAMRNEALKNDGYSPDPSADYDLTLWDTTRYTNWQKELIGGTAQYTNINASISGGSVLMQYFISGTVNRQTNVFPGNFDDRKGTLYFNTTASSKDQRFKLQLSGSYVIDKNHLPGIDLTQSALLIAPDAPPLYNADGTLNWAPNASGATTFNNPLAYIVGADFNNSTKNLVSNLNLSYQILPGLNIRSNFGYSNTQNNLYSPQRLEVNYPEDRPTSQRRSSILNRSLYSWIMEPQSEYSGKLGKGTINGLVGFSVQQGGVDVLQLTGSGYSTDLLMKTLTAATTVRGSSTSTQSKFNGLFGRLNYTWQQKYIINLTARRDGSSKFGDANKLHNFGSVGAGWIFSEESWVKQAVSFLSFGKLRGSYGTTGNDQIGDFGNLSLYGITSPGILYQGAIGLRPNKIPNPYLQWEETRKLQGGLDLGFINDRIIFGATYSRNRSSNQLISYVLPSTTGFTTINKNFPALIQNTNWEFVLNTTNIKTKDFQWTLSTNLTVPRNKLISFPGIENTAYASGDNGVIIGQSLGVVKVFKYAGVDPATGSYQVYDKDGKPTASPNFPPDNPAYISNLTKFYGGLLNSISYKGIQLDFLFQFVRQKGSRDLYYYNGFDNAYAPGVFLSNAFGNEPVNVLNRWQKPGDNAEFASYTTNAYGQTLFPVFSDAWYSYDASYIRLKNLSLSWQLPSRWIQRAKFQSVRLYCQGQNLLTITKYPGLDPENLSTTSLPPLRVITFGAQLGL